MIPYLQVAIGIAAVFLLVYTGVTFFKKKSLASVPVATRAMAFAFDWFTVNAVFTFFGIVYIFQTGQLKYYVNQYADWLHNREGVFSYDFYFVQTYALIICGVYSLIAEGLRQKTLGKHLFDIKVGDQKDGESFSWISSLIRNIVKVAPMALAAYYFQGNGILAVALAFIFVSRLTTQRLLPHDFIAKTQLWKVPEKIASLEEFYEDQAI